MILNNEKRSGSVSLMLKCMSKIDAFRDQYTAKFLKQKKNPMTAQEEQSCVLNAWNNFYKGKIKDFKKRVKLQNYVVTIKQLRYVLAFPSNYSGLIMSFLKHPGQKHHPFFKGELGDLKDAVYSGFHTISDYVEDTKKSYSTAKRIFNPKPSKRAMGMPHTILICHVIDDQNDHYKYIKDPDSAKRKHVDSALCIKIPKGKKYVYGNHGHFTRVVDNHHYQMFIHNAYTFNNHSSKLPKEMRKQLKQYQKLNKSKLSFKLLKAMSYINDFKKYTNHCQNFINLVQLKYPNTFKKLNKSYNIQELINNDKTINTLKFNANQPLSEVNDFHIYRQYNTFFSIVTANYITKCIEATSSLLDQKSKSERKSLANQLTNHMLPKLITMIDNDTHDPFSSSRQLRTHYCHVLKKLLKQPKPNWNLINNKLVYIGTDAQSVTTKNVNDIHIVFKYQCDPNLLNVTGTPDNSLNDRARQFARRITKNVIEYNLPDQKFELMDVMVKSIKKLRNGKRQLSIMATCFQYRS